MRRILAALALCAAVVAPLAAQARPVLRGEVVHGDARTPAAAVLIEVVDALGGVAGRSLTGAGGRFSIELPAGSTYTLRALRVGYRPTVVPDVVVPDTGASVRVVLGEVAIRLNVARVTTDDACGVHTDSGGVIATAWEEVRKALASADATNDLRQVRAEVLNWHSVHAINGDGPVYQSFANGILLSAKPYAGASAAEVARSGYARAVAGGAVDYLGPDAETLTSPLFAMSHCFRLVPPTPNRAWLGIAFRPLPRRTGYAIVEIEGTFWVDTATAALRLLEYRYTNGPPESGRVGAGGRIEFDRLTSGDWIVRRWAIRLATNPPPGSIPENPTPANSDPRSVRRIYPVSPAPYASVSGGTVIALKGDDVPLLAPAEREWRVRVVPADATASLDGATVELAGADHFALADSSGVAILANPPLGRHTLIASNAVMRGLSLPAARVTVTVTAGSADPASIRLPGAIDLLRDRCGSGADSRRIAAVYGAVAAPDDTVRRENLRLSWITDAERSSASGARWLADSVSIAAGRDPDATTLMLSPDNFGRWHACGVPRGSTVRVIVLDSRGTPGGVAYARVNANDRLVFAGALTSASR